MNLKDLEYFTELAREGSFTKVAERFHISQPTVTYAVKRLEDALGTDLIVRDRSHKTVVLTQAGRILNIHAAKIFKEIEVAENEISRSQEDIIKLGLPPIIGNFYLRKLFPSLSERGLADRIHLVNGGSNDLYHLLIKGEIDMALLGSVYPIHDENLTDRLLIRSRFTIVVNDRHPLAKRKSISMGDVKDEKFVLLDSHYVHLNAFRKFLQFESFEPKIIYKSKDLSILKGMIREGVGIGFLTELAKDPADGLIYLPIDNKPQLHFNVSLAQRKDPMKSNCGRQIFESICSSYGSEQTNIEGN